MLWELQLQLPLHKLRCWNKGLGQQWSGALLQPGQGPTSLPGRDLLLSYRPMPPCLWSMSGATTVSSASPGKEDCPNVEDANGHFTVRVTCEKDDWLMHKLRYFSCDCFGGKLESLRDWKVNCKNSGYT